MFADTKAFSAFAVDDLAQARKFYGETLGIRVSEQHGLLTLHLADGRDTRAYPKPDHTPATYTILMFPGGRHRGRARRADHARRPVRAIRGDGPGQAGHHRGGGPFIAACFKDPAGNFLEVLQER